MPQKAGTYGGRRLITAEWHTQETTIERLLEPLIQLESFHMNTVQKESNNDYNYLSRNRDKQQGEDHNCSQANKESHSLCPRQNLILKGRFVLIVPGLVTSIAVQFIPFGSGIRDTRKPTGYK